MSSQVIHVKNIDVADITFGVARTLDSGGKNIPLFHKGKPLVIQTEEMRIPFGIRDAYGASDVAGSDGTSAVSSGKKNIEFSIEKDSAPFFFDKISALDSEIINHAMKNSKQWFRKQHDNRDVLEALYTPMIKFSRDKETGEISQRYAPLFKANLPVKQCVVTTEVYDTNRNKIDVSTNDLRGARGIAIVQCSGVWVAGGKFGCSWRVLQMRVSSSPSKISGYAFIEDPSESSTSTEVFHDAATTTTTTTATPKKCVTVDAENPVSAAAAAFM